MTINLTNTAVLS